MNFSPGQVVGGPAERRSAGRSRLCPARVVGGPAERRSAGKSRDSARAGSSAGRGTTLGEARWRLCPARGRRRAGGNDARRGKVATLPRAGSLVGPRNGARRRSRLCPGRRRWWAGGTTLGGKGRDSAPGVRCGAKTGNHEVMTAATSCRHVPGTRRDPREGGTSLGDERATLVEYLRWQRLTLELKCAGLDAEQLARRSVEPSTMSLLGLVRHMADVERAWFRRRMAGQDVPQLLPVRRRAGRRLRRCRAPTPRSSRRRGRPGGRRSRSPSSSSPRRTDLDVSGTDGARQPGLAARGAGAHDRGVRPAQRPRRPAARADRRPRRPVNSDEWRRKHRAQCRIGGVADRRPLVPSIREPRRSDEVHDVRRHRSRAGHRSERDARHRGLGRDQRHPRYAGARRAVAPDRPMPPPYESGPVSCWSPTGRSPRARSGSSASTSSSATASTRPSRSRRPTRWRTRDGSSCGPSGRSRSTDPDGSGGGQVSR